MENKEPVSTLLARIPGAILEKTRFGRSEQEIFWLTSERLKQALGALKSEGGFDQLENLSAMQVEDNLVLTYFVRSSGTNAWTILRTSLPIRATDDWVESPSAREVFPMAKPFEEEICELFGVKFDGLSASARKDEETWKGFPLRKSFAMTGGVSP